MLVRVNSVLKVWSIAFDKMGYNLQKDGWLNSFTDEKNQALSEDGVPWRGAREKRHEFYSILFSALTDKDDIVMDWQCGLGLFSTFLFLIFYYFISLCYTFLQFGSKCFRWFHYCVSCTSAPYCSSRGRFGHFQRIPPPHARP